MKNIIMMHWLGFIEDITSNKTNRNILRLLKDNDPSFDMLRVCNTASGFLLSRSYIPEDGEDVWVGWDISLVEIQVCDGSILIVN